MKRIVIIESITSPEVEETEIPFYRIKSSKTVNPKRVRLSLGHPLFNKAGLSAGSFFLMFNCFDDKAGFAQELQI